MASHVNTTSDQKKTITSDLRRTDGTTSNGSITSAIASDGEGAGTRVTLVTSGGVYSLSDAADCAELSELCADMIAHWNAVAAAVAEVAAALAQ